MIFDSVASAHLAAIQSYKVDGFDSQASMPLMANPEIFALMADHLRLIPLLTFRHQSTPFVHGQILSAGIEVCFSHEGTVGEKVFSDEEITSWFLQTRQHRLLSLRIEQLTLTEFLAAFHNLVAILFACLFKEDRKEIPPPVPEALVNLYRKWAHHFQSVLPRTLSSKLSAWQAWVIAESARRTLLCSVWVDGVLEVVQQGYCQYRPMVESLPFDLRTGLWEANAEEEWQAAVASHGGSESSLVSWAEFIESGGPEPRKSQDGMLQRLLLVTHFGGDVPPPSSRTPKA